AAHAHEGVGGQGARRGVVAQEVGLEAAVEVALAARLPHVDVVVAGDEGDLRGRQAQALQRAPGPQELRGQGEVGQVPCEHHVVGGGPVDVQAEGVEQAHRVLLPAPAQEVQPPGQPLVEEVAGGDTLYVQGVDIGDVGDAHRVLCYHPPPCRTQKSSPR